MEYNDPLRSKYNAKMAGMNTPIAKPQRKQEIEGLGVSLIYNYSFMCKKLGFDCSGHSHIALSCSNKCTSGFSGG
ncbi:unnamed protein product [Prunus armeniaca]|uniref:Uncharacterized protein n=1 Tax=Prunus armeniaca TaxID=36596 RepID=A0A6J5X944_PRUAR|nr:unnamed protein product [Prunus armeniaca]